MLFNSLLEVKPSSFYGGGFLLSTDVTARDPENVVRHVPIKIPLWTQRMVSLQIALYLLYILQNFNK